MLTHAPRIEDSKERAECAMRTRENKETEEKHDDHSWDERI